MYAYEAIETGTTPLKVAVSVATLQDISHFKSLNYPQMDNIPLRRKRRSTDSKVLKSGKVQSSSWPRGYDQAWADKQSILNSRTSIFGKPNLPKVDAMHESVVLLTM